MTPTTGDTLAITSTTHGASSIKTGDAAGTDAHITIDADGTVYLKNTTTTNAQVTSGGMTSLNKRTLWVPIANMVPAGTNGADEASVEYHATDAGTLKKLKYDKTTAEFADFSLVMPEQWDGGTMKAKFYWSSATSGGTTVWGIKSRGIGDGESFTGWGSEVTSNDTSTGANALNISPSTAAMTAGNVRTNIALLFFRVSRKVDSGSDDHDDDTRLIGVNIEYTEQLEPHTAF